MKKMIRCLAMLLVLTVLLCGCDAGGGDSEIWMLELYYGSLDLVPYDEMEYERPDLTRHAKVLEESCRIALESKDLDEVLEAVYAYYDQYYWFSTNYALANIRYSTDLTDLYWEQEYDYCAEHTAEVDAGLDRLFHALADSPIREDLEGEDYFGPDFFDEYEGESLWDETFTALMEQESQLVSRYYELSADPSAQDPANWRPMGDLLAELVRLRHEIATYAGYDDYNQFAYEFYYERDYTPAQVEQYLTQIQEDLVPMYVRLDSNLFHPGYAACTEAEAFEYLKTCVQNMGGMVESAFGMLEEYGLYDITYSKKKFAASFETFLSYYEEPFLFMNPRQAQTDKLTLVHEFGHFANDYASVGSYAGIDTAEVYSQALEYLSLQYGPNGNTLSGYKMAESLCVFVEQSAYADFEHRLYTMAPEEVTADKIRWLFNQVGRDYGFDTWNFDSRTFVQVPHFYTSAQYVISYVVSNDAAFQIYQKELAEVGAGLALYQASLSSQAGGFLEFLEEQRLESPFGEGRVAEIRKTLEEMLK